MLHYNILHWIPLTLPNIISHSTDISKHYISFHWRYPILHCVLLTWSNIIRPSSGLHWHEKTLHCISPTLHCISLTLHCISLTLQNTTVIIHFEVQQPFPVVWVTVAVRRSLPLDHLSRPCWYTKQHISQGAYSRFTFTSSGRLTTSFTPSTFSIPGFESYLSVFALILEHMIHLSSIFFSLLPMCRMEHQSSLFVFYCEEYVEVRVYIS